MISLAELHGLIVHLPVLAVPLLALLTVLAWRGIGGDLVRRSEPWTFGAAAIGSAVAVASGLTVFGTARATLRGSSQWLILAHLAVGFLLAGGLSTLGIVRRRRHLHGRPPVSYGALSAAAAGALALTVSAGYLGGRMVYAQGVGVAAGGQFARTAQGAEALAAGLARGGDPVVLGRRAFQTGLACASCHGMRAQGGRAPALAGGFDVGSFRGTHGSGLFPASVVGGDKLAALEAWLKTLPPVPGGGDATRSRPRPG